MKKLIVCFTLAACVAGLTAQAGESKKATTEATKEAKVKSSCASCCSNQVKAKTPAAQAGTAKGAYIAKR
ncbi:MAG: hypothetical protein AB1813_23975 [Verrucomicrobiota bacterium]|jgi:hypothetical protein